MEGNFADGKGKFANEAVEKLMNQVKEMLEEHSYEEIFEENPDEAYHIEYFEEAFKEDEVLSLNDLDENIQAVIPPTHQEENTMSYDPFEDLDDSLFHDLGTEGALEEPSDRVDQHIDTFIQIGKCGWDMSLFTFDGDPTYDVEGSPQTKDWSLCIYDSNVWDGDDDMIIDLLDPFENELSQHLQCYAYPFRDALFFYEDFHTSPLILEEYQDISIPGKSKVHSMKWKFCHLVDSLEDSQTKRQLFFFF
jgi:hypothetical protein